MRKPGFYWVIFQGKHVVAEYLGNYWGMVFTHDEQFKDSDFTWISANHLRNPAQNDEILALSYRIKTLSDDSGYVKGDGLADDCLKLCALIKKNLT